MLARRQAQRRLKMASTHKATREKKPGGRLRRRGKLD